MDGFVSLKDVVNILSIMADGNLSEGTTDFPETPQNRIEFGMITRETEK